MKTTDIRDQNFDLLRATLDEKRRAVLYDLATHGPATTRQLATLSGRDILSVRPRITELLQMGLVVLHDRENGEGVYRCAAQAEWEMWHDKLVEEQCTGQIQMI